MANIGEYVLVSGAGDTNVNGKYPFSGYTGLNGYSIYYKSNNYRVEYKGFRTDPNEGGQSTIQWGIFNTSNQAVYYGSISQNGGGNPAAVDWNAATPDERPPFSDPPAPTVQLLMASGKPLTDNLCLNTLVSKGITATVEPTGATNLATSQVTASNSAQTLAVARPTRISVAFYNTDSTNGAYIGPATVTSANGTFLPAKSGQSFTWTGLIQVIAAAGSPVITVADEYN